MGVCVDWLTVSAPDARMESLRAWWSAKCGEKCEPTNGNAGYRRAMRWPDGARLAFEQVGGAKTCSLSLSGDALAAFDGAGRLGLLRELTESGCKATRIDIAVDWRSERETLIDDVQAAAGRGELVGFVRRENVEVVGGGDDGARTVYLGRRGKKGGGRFVRVYDKGVEQHSCPPGTWVRWEAVFSGPFAVQASAKLLASVDPVAEMAGLSLGVCDFRIPAQGEPKRAWPRAAWWSDRLGGAVPVSLTAARRIRDFERFMGWLRQNTKGVLAMATALGIDPGAVFERLTRGVEPSESLARGRVVRQGVEWFRRGLDSVTTPVVQS